MAEQLAQRDTRLAPCRELGPHPGHPLVVVQRALADQAGDAERGDRLLVVFSLGVAFEEDANSAIFIFRLEDLNEKS